MKRFNTTGTCFPRQHYMVDISERVAIIRGMVEQGDYFCINRGRQYGKTTTLEAVSYDLSHLGYVVFPLSFEGMDDNVFISLDSLLGYTLRLMQDSVKWKSTTGLNGQEQSDFLSIPKGDISPIDFMDIVSTMCLSHQTVLLIDEVDQAGNHDAFIKFLGVLRNAFLKRGSRPTFKSVILAGVYDIKSLKLKIRDESEHQYNSPWNIAAPFDVDMSLHTDGIAGMLHEYKEEHGLSFDEHLVADEIHAYTGGYPYLVSRLCQIIDSEQYNWDKNGVVNAVHDILNEHNTLFDDLVKKLNQFPELKKVLKSALFSGEKASFNPDEKYLQLAERFCYINNEHGSFMLSNRILETRLYNLFTKESEMERIYTEGSIDKNQFIVDGMLNLRHMIERFTVHYNDIYGSQGDAFKEKEGRKLFLLYLRPVINGIGNYYIEAATRDETRTDIVIDYLGHQYVIELKIWRGKSYNERGEKQLSNYLDYFHLDTGYLVSFCFNSSKKPGIYDIQIGDRIIHEAIV